MVPPLVYFSKGPLFGIILVMVPPLDIILVRVPLWIYFRNGPLFGIILVRVPPLDLF